MLIKIRELCDVDCIDENDENERDDLTAERVVIYETESDTIEEALEDYESNFDIDCVVNEHDYFDGCCLDVVEILSVEEVDNCSI